MLLYSTFISGMQEVIRKILAAQGVKSVRQMLDGAVVYESEHIPKLPCFNNTFEVLLERKMGGKNATDRMAASILSQGEGIRFVKNAAKRRAAFRIVVSDQNQLVSLDARKRGELEKLISRRTGLSVDRVRPQEEYWILARSEGVAFFLRRVTHHRVGEQQLEKGELRPELTYLMNWLSSPKKDDVYLDPFCGSGALLLSRAEMGPYAQLYGLDIEVDKVRRVRQKAKGIPPDGLTLEAADMQTLPALLKGKKASKIVTDPPWGFYEQYDIPTLYQRMFATFSQIAAKGATIILLSARKDEMERVLAGYGEAFQRVAVYHILVSGKKAAVYQLAVR